MRALTCISLLFLAIIPAFSQLIRLGHLPDSLKTDANEMILEDNTYFNIKDIHSSKLRRNYRAVILNSKADNLTDLVLYYSNFREIVDADIKIYSLLGKELDHIKLKDFGDFSTKGYSVASDSRAKYYKITENRFPYVIEVAYEVSYKGSMFYPAWIPQSSENLSVVEAKLIIEAPVNSFRHKSSGVMPKISTSDGRDRYEWSVASLPAFEYETLSYSIEDYAPVVYTAPNDFEMEGYEGNLSSWDSFGLWINQLNANKNTLPPGSVEPITSQFDESYTVIDKVQTVYQYLQDNTRYVSIQLGIGGWQPFESGFVHENKYGDCKALSFYTQSLLKEIGIDSYYTLINAGAYSHRTNPDFPEAHFNHAILTVPMENDTIWLECTSQTNPFGYLGKFTSNRFALMVTEEGGVMIKTRDYNESENVQTTIANVAVNADGSADIDLTRNYSGLEIENDSYRGATLKSETEQRKWFYDKHSWGNLELKELTIDKISYEELPKGAIKANLVLKNAASSNANRLFFKPTIFTDISGLKLNGSSRKYPLEVRYPYSQVDTLIVSFPEQFYPESKLGDEEINSVFGNYSRRVIQQENKFVIIRTFSLKKGEYTPESYGDFKGFIREVQKYDRKRLVMINKT
ncbi:MAG: DUF3857 domain-containing protein [Marinoscillum sp.]